MHWNTKELMKALRALGEVTVQKQEPGGDHDTEEILVKVKGRSHDWLHICGFNSSDEELDPKDDVEVEMVEVSDGLDSAGGLNSEDEQTCILYGRICSLLRKKGFCVVPRMEDYF